jgi:ribonuclease HI
VVAEVRTSYNLASGTSNSSITDFRIMQLFNLQVRAIKNIVTFDICWQLPSNCTVKANVDGSAVGNPSSASIGVVFRDKEAKFWGGFVHNIGHATTFMAELCASMFAIEKAAEKNWQQIWIETDSVLVTKAFIDSSLVPWCLRNRWENCLLAARRLSLSCTHIHREGNQVANALASNGQGLAPHTAQWWDNPPGFILSLLVRDRSGMPYQRTL